MKVINIELFIFTITWIIVIIILSLYFIIEPGNLPNYNYTTFPNVSPPELPDADVNRQELCYTSLQKCDEAMGCAACGNQFECTEIVPGQDVIFNGSQVQPGKWCLPNNPDNKKCGTYTGRWIWSNKSVNQQWECECLYPDLFSGDTCTTNSACRDPVSNEPQDDNQLVSTLPSCVNKQTSDCDDNVKTCSTEDDCLPSYQCLDLGDGKKCHHVWNTQLPEFNPYDTTPYDKKEDGTPVYQCLCNQNKGKDGIQYTNMPNDPHRCHIDPCKSDHKENWWTGTNYQDTDAKCDCKQDLFAKSNIYDTCFLAGGDNGACQDSSTGGTFNNPGEADCVCDGTKKYCKKSKYMCRGNETTECTEENKIGIVCNNVCNDSRTCSQSTEFENMKNDLIKQNSKYTDFFKAPSGENEETCEVNYGKSNKATGKIMDQLNGNTEFSTDSTENQILNEALIKFSSDYFKYENGEIRICPRGACNPTTETCDCDPNRNALFSGKYCNDYCLQDNTEIPVGQLNPAECNHSYSQFGVSIYCPPNACNLYENRPKCCNGKSPNFTTDYKYYCCTPDPKNPSEVKCPSEVVECPKYYTNPPICIISSALISTLNNDIRVDQLSVGDTILSGITGKPVKILLIDKNFSKQQKIYGINDHPPIFSGNHCLVDPLNLDNKLVFIDPDYMKQTRKYQKVSQIKINTTIKENKNISYVNKISSIKMKNIDLYDIVTEDFSYIANGISTYTGFPEIYKSPKLAIITKKMLVDNIPTIEEAVNEIERNPETIENALTKYCEAASKDSKLIMEGKKIFRNNFEKFKYQKL